MAGRRRLPFSFRVLRAWAFSAVSVFYRRVEVTSRVPDDRPVILAANHGNALADPAVMLAKMPKFPRFLATATWWKSPPVRLFFRLAGVVPIHRRRDVEDIHRNTSAFEACHAALAAGAHIAIFPEGELHVEPALLPLKTGAARIALGAAADAGVRGIVIVPVGLVYDDRGRFRSDAEINFGEPIEIDEWVQRYRADAAKAVRAVTDLLADRLASATVNHGSRHEATVIDRAAAFALADEDGVSSYARRNALRRALAASVALAGGESSAEFRDLADAVDAHTRDLERIGVNGSDGAPGLAAPPASRQQLRAELAVLATPAAVGLVANAPMLAAVALVGRRVPHETWQATVKGVAGTFLTPAVWALEYAALARRRGRRAALALTAAGAVGGLATLAWHERWRRERRYAWRDTVARGDSALFAAAVTSRARVCEQVKALVG
jgi:1-acyl-sn-glycerol-3-phosphate acyltransferase